MRRRRRDCNTMRACDALTSPTNFPELIAQTPLAERRRAGCSMLDGAAAPSRIARCATSRAAAAGRPAGLQRHARRRGAARGRQASGGRVEIFLERASHELRGAGAAARQQADSRRARGHDAGGVVRMLRAVRTTCGALDCPGRRWSSSSNGARCRCRRTFTRAADAMTASAIRASLPASAARWRRRPPACISMRR